MTTPDHDDGVLAALRRQARLLVVEVTGPLRRIQVSRGDAAVEIEWHGNGHLAEPAASGAARPTSPTPASGTDQSPEPAPGPDPHRVVSPMVGTFYRAPEPGATPFVTVGDLVEPGRVIGIVEAMKLMNEITADQAGRVLDVLVDDGEPVEFDQPLIALGPA
jgi:acetyl-CoA carboxylase biotin carboxyl carrier protein